MEHLPLSTEPRADGTWVVYVGHVPVRADLSREEAEWWVTRLPQEVVAGTRQEGNYKNRGVARERVSGIADRVPETIETSMGLVRKSADGWGFGLYDNDNRYWFRTPVRGVPGARPSTGRAEDPAWIQTDGLPVVTERTLVWVGLNPSMSDDNPRANRVTLLKVLRWAQLLRKREVLGVNLFAYRHTSPDELGSQLKTREALAVIGEHTDRVLEHALAGRGTVLAAWGRHGWHLNRGDTVRRRISEGLCLGICANGQPKHPARLPQTTPLIPLPSIDH